MSSLITNTEEIESPSFIKNTLRKVSFNPVAFRSSCSSTPSISESTQQLLLSSICKKINKVEKENIRAMAFE